MAPGSPDAAIRRWGRPGAPCQARGGGGGLAAEMPNGPPTADRVTGHTGAAEGGRAAPEFSSSARAGETPDSPCGQLPPGDRGSHEETADVSAFLTNRAKATGGSRNLGILGHWRRKWPHGPGNRSTQKILRPDAIQCQGVFKWQADNPRDANVATADGPRGAWAGFLGVPVGLRRKRAR